MEKKEMSKLLREESKYFEENEETKKETNELGM